MPDLPGGPTDPENVLNCIRTGATWRDSLIYVAAQGYSLHADGGKWTLSTRLGTRISLDTFERLHSATTNEREPGYVRIEGLRYRLDLVNGWAELAPA